MKTLSIILGLIFLISCGSNSSQGEIKSSDTEVLADTLIEPSRALNIVPPATVNDACLPYPSEEFCHLIAVDSAYQYELNTNYLYSYIVAHFDSLGGRVHEEMEDLYDMGVYSWSQKFSDGIVYSEYFGGEGGSTATIYTKCTSKEGIYSTLNALVNYEMPDAEYKYAGEWNDEKTEYGPEGAGCYYSIILNDSTGFYYIENYCGC